MKIAIIETDHFQYGLTQSELFQGAEKLFFVTPQIGKEMKVYNEQLCDGEFIIIDNIAQGADEIIRVCNEAKIDLLLLSPVFYRFEAVLKIATQIKCKKVITIHNLNYWFNSRFRTPSSYKERKIKQKIVKLFDYIAVEDFIYNYLKTENRTLFDSHKFIYIPFTIFQKNRPRKFQKTDNVLKVVLPGSIHKDRRRYEDVIEVINRLSDKNIQIKFSFAGKPLEDYGLWVVAQLEKANEKSKGMVSYFAPEMESNPEMFMREMETSDLVLSTSTKEFKALGTTEYIGKTKPTAAIHDMMSFELPGLLPEHLVIPENLKGSVFNYSGVDELEKILIELANNPSKVQEWKNTAAKNSLHFTADEIKKNLPFFPYQCKRCVMDKESDPFIHFDNEGHCNYCNAYFEHTNDEKVKNEHQFSKIASVIEQIKKEGHGKKYDCIVGISGGTDSAFLIYKLVELGLRPLAVHYDNGWNSETATKNIEMLLKKLNVDLYTCVNDWEEFKDLQLSFLKAGVIDIELLTDLAIISLLYQTSVKFKTKYIFTGHNTATEFILPESWYHWKLDSLNIIDIQKKHGSQKIKTFPYLTYFQQYYHAKYRKTKMISLLDYVDYHKTEAQELLTNKFGWKNYGGKHNESIFTRFYQNYILPVKFKVDKRKAHLSSLICSGQISREDALKELQIEIWNQPQTLEDKAYVMKKLGMSEEKFNKIMSRQPVSHLAYASYLTKHDRILRKLKRLLGRK